MDYPPVSPDARNLEEAFFAQENQRLLAKLKEKQDRDAKRAALREVMPNADDEFVDHMHELNIGPEMILAITMVPLVAVAWADGNIADNPLFGAIYWSTAQWTSLGGPQLFWHGDEFQWPALFGDGHAAYIPIEQGMFFGADYTTRYELTP